MPDLRYDTKPYIDSIEAYTVALKMSLKIAEDGFKAPELTVQSCTDVIRAAFEMQVEYAAMMRYRDRVVEQ